MLVEALILSAGFWCSLELAEKLRILGLFISSAKIVRCGFAVINRKHWSDEKKEKLLSRLALRLGVINLQSLATSCLCLLPVGLAFYSVSESFHNFLELLVSTKILVLATAVICCRYIIRQIRALSLFNR